MKCYLLHNDQRLPLTRSVPEVARDMFNANPDLTTIEFAKSPHETVDPHVRYTREGDDIVWYARVQSHATVTHVTKRDRVSGEKRRLPVKQNTVREAPDVGEWVRVGVLDATPEPDTPSEEVFRAPTDLEVWEEPAEVNWKFRRIEVMTELRRLGVPLDILEHNQLTHNTCPDCGADVYRPDNYPFKDDPRCDFCID